MPNIREVNASDASFRATETGADAVASSGRRVGALTAEAADRRAQGISAIAGALTSVGQDTAQEAERYISHKEEMKVSADYAGMQNQALKTWDAALKNGDPNDPDLERNYRENVLQPMLDDFTGRYTTQRGQERAAAMAGALTDTMNLRIRADRNTLAAEQGVLDVTHTHNMHTDTLMDNPSMLDSVQAQTDALITTMKQAPGTDAIGVKKIENLGIKMREDNVVAAVHGIAERDPKAARAALDANIGEGDLSAAQRSTLYSYVGAQERHRDAMDKGEAVAQKQKNVTAAGGFASQLVAKSFTDDGAFLADKNFFQGVKQLALMPDVSPELVKSLYDMGKSVTDRRKAEVTGAGSDPTTFEDMRNRMSLPLDDRNRLSLDQVFRANADNKLSDHDMKFFKEALDSKDPAYRAAFGDFNKTVNSFKPLIQHSTTTIGQPLPAEAIQWGQFQTEARDLFENAYKGGTQQQLLDPKSQLYLGKLARSHAYGTKQEMELMLNSMKSGTASGVAPPVKNAEPRKPGESTSDYLHRTGG